MKRPLANSEDETESESLQYLFVSNYHLVDDDDEPVSFSVLPIHWSDSESSDCANKGSTFLHGSADNGLQKIFMQVIAWRFDLSGVKPEISLLSKDRRWIRLQKPRKSFLDTVRTVLITIYFLHRVKKNTRMSAKGIWNNLCKNKDLSSYGFKPSRKDLSDHMHLIAEAAKRDADLARSKLLIKVLEEKRGNQKLSVEEVEDLPLPGLIVDDIDNDIIDNANEDSNAEDDLFNSVCTFCDNGGNLLCCDGGCMRSFHATKDDGREAFCDSLGFTQKEVDEIESFYCKNCEYHQHQCFACGKLGSSDKVKGAEVIKCATCDSFYHPHCVSKLLLRVVKHVSEELEKNIADGDPFTCPIHYCWVCKGLENKTAPELQFAVCRRCPKSYHRKCLPREIAFDCRDDEDIKPRAWEGLLPNNRILMYCLNHEIVDELGTPIRDHIKFPDTRDTVVREINTTKKRMKPATKKRAILKKKSVDFDNSSGKSTAKGSKVPVGSKKSSEKMISGSDISTKLKSNEISRSLTENKKSISKKVGMPNCEENKQPTGEKLCALMNKGSERTKHDDQVYDVDNETLSVKPIRSVLPPLDADSEGSLLDLFKKAGSSILSEDVVEKHTLGNVDQERHKGHEYRTSKYGKTSLKSKSIKENDRRGLGMASLAKRRAVNGVPERLTDHSQPTPIDGRSSVEGFQHKSVMASARVEVDNNDDGNLEPISDFGRSYSGIERSPSVASPLSDSGIANTEEHHKRGEEKHRRESDIRQEVDLSGFQNPNRDHLSGHDPSCGDMRHSDAHLSPVIESSYKMNTPAVEPYVPQEDELNHVRMSSLGTEPPIFSRSGTFDRCVPLPGFAPGLNLAYSRHNSAGWLDE